ncbi:MAG: 3-mercaptopyruvate sulfurtransferase [Alphaproteobacteria bacterium]|nr:MAG: 3-mercaptopyruvate sulfurtransferase [Alphaproteobacteria bacterium]
MLDLRRAQEPALVTTDWLAAHLDAPDVRIMDASWHLPDSGRDALAEYGAAHIPGALFFDIETIADQDQPLPHMAPPPELFASRMRRLGIGDGHKVILYDSGDLPSAPRAWWTFRLMGHGDVAVLDGGLKKWRREGRPLTDLVPEFGERHFTARFQAPLVADMARVKAALADPDIQVVDARPADRFEGKAPEPRAQLPSGHIPGSLNLPYSELYAADGTLLPVELLRERAAARGIDPLRPTIATCGSGITACTIALAFHLLGNEEVAVFDGAWCAWGSDPDNPVATGDQQEG